MTYIKNAKVTGCGHYLPKKVLTNVDLEKIVDTSDEWITTRTGIKQRQVVEDELTSDLAYNAAKMALENAGVGVSEIDLVIVGTITTDNSTPSTACYVGKKLGVKAGIPCFDLSAACSGFMYSLQMASNMIKLGQATKAVVIGAESLSKITDWTDRNTCVLFGDGAGAVVLEATDDLNEGVLFSKIYADPSHTESLLTKGGVSSTQNAGILYMDGQEVFKSAVTCLVQGAEDALKGAGYTINDVDWLISHQANSRIIDMVGKKLGIESEKVIMTLDHHGNTSAASIPLALSESVAAGKIKKGDLVLLTSMGAGFTWGGALVRI
ncbi:MAG: beta-ketoacyl-ACP synthase III [Alphaproteobacteria bacterium]